MFTPRVALASLSGRSDAAWARQSSSHAGCALLGGIAIDDATRDAARRLVDRDRTEFLPPDPVTFVDDQLAALDDIDLRPGINVRSATVEPVARLARVCRRHDAVLELNAHCRQAEMCAAGAGESLLTAPDRLADQVAAASGTGATVSVKVRAEVEGVDLGAVAEVVAGAGGDAIHVDAMDTESVVADVAGNGLFVIANNGVRDRESVHEYLDYGADAVSVGRASDDPSTLRRVRAATESWRVEVAP